MDGADIALRNLTYRMFVAAGGAPSAQDVAAAAHLTVPDVIGGWRRLADAHALVLLPTSADGTTALRMASPFSAVPTPYRVSAADRWWYANCAWDAFGICAALQVDGRIEATCPDCAGAIEVRVRERCPDDGTLLFHCLVPAAQWWDDIVFT